MQDIHAFCTRFPTDWTWGERSAKLMSMKALVQYESLLIAANDNAHIYLVEEMEQARYYDPSIGRFLSIDPINFTPDQTFMFGRYTYVNNDPVNNTDPTGMQMEPDFTYAAYIGAGYSPAAASQNAREQRSASNAAALQTGIIVAGVGIIAFDVLTVPSGEGAIGTAMIGAAVKTIATNAAIGMGTSSVVDVAMQLDQTGGDITQIDLGQTAAKLPEAAFGGAVGGAFGRQAAAGLGAMGPSAAQLTDDAVLQGVLKITEYGAAKAAGATASGLVKSQIPDIKREEDNR